MVDEERKSLNVIKRVGIGLLILFLIITAVYIVKIVNQDTCGRTTYTDYQYGELQEATTMDSANMIVYQENPYPRDKNIKEWRFCFTANATTPTEIEIINARYYLLGRAILREGRYNYCYNIMFPPDDHEIALLAYSETYNYIGLRCPLCAEQNNQTVTLYEEILGVDVERTIELAGVYYVNDENTLDYVLHAYPSCWENIKYFVIWYLIAIIMLVIIAGVFVGKKKIQEVLEF